MIYCDALNLGKNIFFDTFPLKPRCYLKFLVGNYILVTIYHEYKIYKYCQAVMNLCCFTHLYNLDKIKTAFISITFLPKNGNGG